MHRHPTEEKNNFLSTIWKVRMNEKLHNEKEDD